MVITLNNVAYEFFSGQPAVETSTPIAASKKYVCAYNFEEQIEVR